MASKKEYLEYILGQLRMNCHMMEHRGCSW